MKSIHNFINEKLKINPETHQSPYNWNVFLDCLEDITKNSFHYRASILESPSNFPNIYKHCYKAYSKDKGLMYGSVNNPEVLEGIAYEDEILTIFSRPYYEQDKPTSTTILHKKEFNKFLDMFKYFENELNWLYEDIINYNENNN